MTDRSAPGDRWEVDAPRTGLPVVLLADEHDDFRNSIAFHLAMAGYPVVQTGSMAGVMAESRDLRPDVVVVSDELAEDGVAKLLATIADQPDLADVPVITVSSEGTDRLIECLGNGARDHVRRDEGADVLVARIDAVLRTDEELERLRRRNAELEFLGTVDPLTGMANRRYLDEELERLAALATRHQLPLTVVMVRLDEVPGVRGAARARLREAVMRELAYLLAAARRTDDFSGVWDDHTFVLLLPVTPVDGGRIFAERLRAVVSAAPVRSEHESVAVTVTAACSEVGAHPGAVLRRLELAVSTAQADGGNRVAL